MSSQFQDLSGEMRSLGQDVLQLQGVAKITLKLVVDQQYKVGIETVEAAYETFLEGSSNIFQTIASFDYYMAELQTVANQHLRPDKLEEWLRIVRREQGDSVCRDMFNYILVVKSK